MIQQTAWFDRKFDFNFPLGLFPVIVERLRGTASRIENLVKSVSVEILTRKTAGSWSVKEQIGHLYDLEELWYARIENILAGNTILRTADLRNTKTYEARHNETDTVELLKQFSSARRNLIEKVQDVDEATASLTALHPRLQTPMRLIDSLFFVAEHDDHHLAVMRNLLD